MPSKFSIVIPTFNSKEYVVECVASALGQTYPEIEVVVDDNASKDGTPKLLRERFGNDPRLKIFENKEDLNIPLGWSRGMRNATGDYKLLLHSDNLMHPRYCETVSIFLQRFSADVIYSECLYFEGATPRKLFDGINPTDGFPVAYFSGGSRAVDYIFRFQRMIPTSCVAIAKECFESRAAYLSQYKWDPDIEQMTWLALRYRVLHLNIPMVAIRTHPGQAASWKDQTFSSQYRQLLELTHQNSGSERHHFMLHWAGSNQDVVDKLSNLKKSTFVAFHRFVWTWAKAETQIFGHFLLNYARKLKLLTAYSLRWWTRKWR